MAWFGKQKDTITVEFIENGTDTPFAVSEVPIQQLPDTFEIDTNLDIGQQQWSVVQATPNTKEKFAKLGKLKIILDKIQTVDPKSILFSLPTINDSIFELETNVLRQDLLFIHEDDWRQVEFISKKYEMEIAEELKSVVDIYENHKVGIGFNEVHIRNLIEQPLSDKKITVPDLMQTFKIAKQYDGFGVMKVEGKAKDSFAFQVAEEVSFYGQFTEKNYVNFLCVITNDNSKESIRKITERYDVVCVDWCRAEAIKP